MTKRLSFVCLGNICRSPLAEGIFRRLVDEAGLSADFEIESAGIGPWHVGEAPDPRSRQVARAHGLTLDSIAQQITARDMARLDLVLTERRADGHEAHPRIIDRNESLTGRREPHLELLHPAVRERQRHHRRSRRLKP